MPGHTYSKLHRYQDAVWQQEASARVDHAHMMRDRVMPDQIHNFAHNNEWLIRNLVKIGRVDDAIHLAKNMLELPRHPKFNTLKKGSTKFGRERLLLVLSAYRLWDLMIEFLSLGLSGSNRHSGTASRTPSAFGDCLCLYRESRFGERGAKPAEQSSSVHKAELERLKSQQKNLLVQNKSVHRRVLLKRRVRRRNHLRKRCRS